MDSQLFSAEYVVGATEGGKLLARWRGKDVGAPAMARELTHEAGAREGDRLAGFLAAVAAYVWGVMHMGEPNSLDAWNPTEDLDPTEDFVEENHG